MVLIEMATYKKSIEESTIDLIFATTVLLEKLILCNIAEKFDHDFDYQPSYHSGPYK